MNVRPRALVLTFVAGALTIGGALRAADKGLLVAQTTRISVTSDGAEANGGSYYPSISGDGRWVAFTSTAPNLSAGSSPPYPVLLRDNETGRTTRVGSGPSDTLWRVRITADGRYVFGYGGVDVNVYDRISNRTVRVAGSGFYSISEESVSDDLRLGVGTYGFGSCFQSLSLIDLQAGTIQYKDFALDGFPRTVSATGRYVATACVPMGSQSVRFYASVFDLRALPNNEPRIISADGFPVRFSTDDRFLLISDNDGGFYVYDVSARRRIFERNACAIRPAMSPSGRFISYTRPLCGKLNGFSDVYVYDQVTGQTRRVSVASDGTSANSDSYESTVDNEGRVAYRSAATNLVASDTNSASDIFLTSGGVDADLPGEPQQLASRISTASPTASVNLTWNSPVAGADFTTYVVQVGSGPGLNDVANLPTNSLNTSLSAPVNAPGTFFVRVRAANNAGLSVPSNELRVFVGTPAPPTAPVNLQSIVTGSTVLLNWAPPPTGDQLSAYFVEAGSSAGRSDLANFAVGDGSTTTLTGTIAPGTYYLRVRAANEAGTGPPSNEVIVRVVGTTPCRLPPAPRSLSITGGAPALRWSTDQEPTHAVVVEVGTAPGSSDLWRYDFRPDATSSPNILWLYGPYPPRAYFIRVRARNACGTGPASNEISFVVR